MYSQTFNTLKTLSQTLNHSTVSTITPMMNTLFKANGLNLDLAYQPLFQHQAYRDAFSKHAHDAQFEALRNDMFQGNIVNHTEHQPATHVYCRAAVVINDDKNNNDCAVSPLSSTLKLNTEILKHHQNDVKHCLTFAKEFRSGLIKGATGKVLTDYVHLGIGGSDLGPRCVLNSLQNNTPDNNGVRIHFVGNLDPDDFINVVHHLNPETTLFGVASKSFSTLETQANANLAKTWLLQHLSKHFINAHTPLIIARHFCAITSSPDKAAKFLGFDDTITEFNQATLLRHTRILNMQTSIGGRYSLWSAIGLPIVIALGVSVFNELCQGAVDMDTHFLHTPFNHNLPAQLGAIQVWNSTVLNIRCQPTIAYNHRLSLFPNHLQQLDMESNGKSVNRLGDVLDYQTSPVILGGVGTPAQHAFFQWMHQGHDDTASVFIGVNHHNNNNINININDIDSHQYSNYKNDVLLCMNAQAKVLWEGGCFNKPGLLPNHGYYKGSRPVALLTLDTLSPYHLGALIACFEHAVYTAGILWGINSFDQWGVELGKQLYAQAKNKS